MLHPVRFANGEALEARGILQKATIIYWVASSIKPIDKPIPGDHLSGREIEEFIDACWAVIDERMCANHRWIMAMTKQSLVVGELTKPGDIWMIDRETERYFRSKQDSFSFSPHLYEGTIFSGFLLRECVFQPSRLTNQQRQADSGVLQKIRALMGTGNRRKIVYESLETTEYRFHIRGIYRWCAERCCPSTWSAQQLNICLNTPSSEEYWFHKNPIKDAFSFVNELWDEMLPRCGRPSTEEDRFGSSTRNPQRRYPHHNNVVTTLDGERHVAGHYQPRYLEFNPNNHDRIKVEGVRPLRLTRTQYPFVYSLLPDDHHKAKKISDVLKSGGGKALMATVLTQEGERFVRSVFQRNKYHHYKVWYCAKLLLDGKTCWTPIAPVKPDKSSKKRRRKRKK